MIEAGLINFAVCTALGLAGFWLAQFLNRWSRRRIEKAEGPMRYTKIELEMAVQIGFERGFSEGRAARLESVAEAIRN